MERTGRVLRGVRAVLVFGALLGGFLSPPSLQGAAEGPQRAALVVVFGEGQIEARCVEFAEAQVSGTDLLRRSGLAVVLSETKGLGAAVCAVEGVGCQFPAEDCFCRCRGAECRYWTYWRWEGGKWVYSGLGASSRLLGDGDMDAWVWGDGKTSPPPLAFADVCGVPRAPSLVPSTSTPEPTATPLPTATPTRADSPTPTPPQAAESATPTSAGAQTPTPQTKTTETPTATAAPLATPTAPRPERGTPMAAPPAPEPTPTPPLVAGAPAPDAPAVGQYLAFAAMAAALAGAVALARRRKGR